MYFLIRFIEAHQIQQEADKLEKQEYLKYDKDKFNKFKSYTDKLSNTHKNEREQLKHKLDTEYQTFNKKKSDELKILNLISKRKKMNWRISKMKRH
jgi:hypothetical protein